MKQTIELIDKMVDKSNVPKIRILLAGSVLPFDHPAWDSIDIASKKVTVEGSEVSAVNYAPHLLDKIRKYSQDDMD